MYIGELGARHGPRRRRRRPRARGPRLVPVADYPRDAFRYRARVPSFAALPAGSLELRSSVPELARMGPAWRSGELARMRFLGQETPAWIENAPPPPAGMMWTPSGELAPLPYEAYYPDGGLGDLGRPRRRRRGFFGDVGRFLKRGGIVGWVGRQPIVRKILPRPVTAAMRLEFGKIPGALKREFLEPVKPLGGMFGTKKRRRPVEEAPQMIDTALLPTPQPEVPAPIAGGERAQAVNFAPPSYAPAAQMWGDVPPDMPPPEEMMAPEMPGVEEYAPEALVPGAAEYEYPAIPGGLMPGEAPTSGWVSIPEAGLAPGPGAELVEIETSEAMAPAGEELQLEPEPMATEAMMGLGQAPDVVYWWQPTPPFEWDPSLGDLRAEPPAWLRTAARAITGAAPAVIAAVQPQPSDYFTPPTAPGALYPAYAPPPPPPRPAPGMPGWLWPVLGLGVLGTVWVMLPPASAPRRRRVR